MNFENMSSVKLFGFLDASTRDPLYLECVPPPDLKALDVFRNDGLESMNVLGN